MSWLTIVTDASPLYYDQIVQLEGIEYVFEFAWNDRDLSWYLSILDQDGSAIAPGIRLVSGWPLLRKYNDPRLPPGRLILVDMTGTNGEIAAPFDLNTRFLLTYVTSDDPGVVTIDQIVNPNATR